MMLFFSLGFQGKKMVLIRSSFEGLRVKELIQKIDCSMDYKTETNTWFKFDIFGEYISWNFEWMWLRWPKHFPDIIKKLEQNHPFFQAGAPSNEIPFYN